MQHSHSNDDMCFHIDVIDEVTNKKKMLCSDTSEPLSVLDVEEILEQEEEVENNFEELTLKGNLRIKTSIQDPPTNLEMKSFPKHLEYAFLEKDYLLPLFISALLKDDEKKRLVSILKNHKEVFAWKNLTFWALVHLFENIKSNSRMMPNPSFKDNVDLT
ncbi:hypothetical protein Tco_0478500 [Tanacetum coccineum]